MRVSLWQKRYFILYFFMQKQRFPKSVRKHIRVQKARIRREILDVKEQRELISKLYEGFGGEIKKVEEKPKEVAEKEKEAVVAATKEK